MAAVTTNYTSAITDYSFCTPPYPMGGVAWENCTTVRCPVRIGAIGSGNNEDCPATVYTGVGNVEIAFETKNLETARKVGKFFHENKGTLSAATLLLAARTNFGGRGYYPKRDKHGELLPESTTVN